MAQREIDPFEIGRRGLAIPFREFPIWLACALWPFAMAALDEAIRRGAIAIPDWVTEPADWVTGAIFDWCWMTALCRSTTLQLLTFPAARSFWLFLVLQVGLSVFSWLFSGLLEILFFAAFAGDIPFTDISGTGVQLLAILLAVPTILLGIWVGLRLSIWPAHCAATGTLVGPRTIWRGMQDHSFDMFIIIVVTAVPALLFFGGLYFLAHDTLDTETLVTALRTASTVIGTYTKGAFDAAMLIAYFEIFAVKAAR